jgi:multimeric flavodoxin WrbA
MTRRLLIVYGGNPGGRTEKLCAAVTSGIRHSSADVDLRERRALDADADDLLWAEAVILGTPEHFGYMSGALKDFFDRTFYPCENRTAGLPWGLFISAGNDGTGTRTAVERIVAGYRWKSVSEPIIVVGDPDAAALGRCHDLGATLAAGLATGIF